MLGTPNGAPALTVLQLQKRPQVIPFRQHDAVEVELE
jgi:hypothetical protein